MHRKFTEYERFCIQDKKILTKCHVELEDNVDMNKFYILGNIVSGTLFITLNPSLASVSFLKSRWTGVFQPTM